VKAAKASSREQFARSSSMNAVKLAAVRLIRTNATDVSSVATTSVSHLACDVKVSCCIIVILIFTSLLLRESQQSAND